MPVEMERGAVSARGAKSAKRRARIDASIFFTPARQPYCAARWRMCLHSKALALRPIVIYRMPDALMASDTHSSPPPGRSCPDSGPAIATTSLIRLRKRRWRTAGLSVIVAAAR